ncbi:STAS domain-containing protein [Legionella israelensis]|uniref:STAS domain-containing protein n=2 Tax=Legionella israelensis TaxID=454 RepID=A0AAX1EDL5_9GAMM|nr:STAS domain-containing protein [Legionella israelensis]
MYRQIIMKKKAMLTYFTEYERFFPFLAWWPELKHWPILRADLIAGISVAMLLIPQSMAYARLAGLPAYYGLYAAFIPPIVASLFGSSRILSTGPVAITSLITAAALQPIIASGTSNYLLYVILLTLMAGVIQLLLGILRLGIVLNFVSHPVLLGFTNAAALIIATAQLGSLLGVPSLSFSRHYQTVWQVLTDSLNNTHWPTVAISLVAFVSIAICRKFWPRSPRILVAVIITTLISWLSGYEKSKVIHIEDIISDPIREMLSSYQRYPQEFQQLSQTVEETMKKLQTSIKEAGETAEKTAQAMNKVSEAKWDLERRMIKHNLNAIHIQQLRLRKVTSNDNHSGYVVANNMTPIGKMASQSWRVAQIDDKGQVTIQAGGKIVGSIPRGLPEFQMPSLEWERITQLFLAALVIALIGFMEATTITRYLATESKETLDVNQELIGQGLAKITGSFFQSMPVSGAFSRTAVNFKAGAKTGFSSIFAGFIVMLVLLWLTPLFYYLPIATLAVVIIIAALGLLNFKEMIKIYRVDIKEGVVTLTTFILTLILAPKLEYAILLGMLISLGVYLNESRKPRFNELTRNEAGDLVEASPEEETCYLISLIRFGGSLYFANASYFEDKILKLIKEKPKSRYIIVDCVSINNIDASGVETLRNLYQRLDEAGIELWFTRLRQPVLRALENGGLVELLGQHHFHKNNEVALNLLSEYLGAKHMNTCPLAKKT